MNLRYFMLGALCVLSQLVFSQDVRGRVTSQSGESIAFANIGVLNNNALTVADKDGAFSFNLANGDYQIVVTAIGYATKIVPVTVLNNAITVDVVLDVSTQTLGEVVVTANKREEEIMQVATSISSLSAKKIEDTRTIGLENLTALVPNYLYQELGVGFQQVQAIRGIQVFSENPAVATYIDEVNNLDILANGFMLTDVERVEVLRGPQGTLFGRNAMGGVINIVTKKPTNRTEGFAEAGIGNLSLQRHGLGFRTPFVKEKLFFGINGLYQYREGYWKNDTTGTSATDGSLQGRSVGDEHHLYGNAYLKWLPFPNFSATVNVKTQRDWSNATGFFVSQTNENSAFSNPDKINLTRIGKHERDILNTAISLKYFGGGFSVTSISSFQNISLGFEDIDFPGYYHSFYKSAVGEKLPPQRVFSQELRINSTNTTEAIQYTVGIYVFSQVGYEPSTNLVYELTPFEATLYGLPNGTYIISRNKSNNQGFAGFGELSYQLNSFKVTAGLRYDYERREATFNGFFDAIFFDGTVTNFIADTTVGGTYSALSPKLGLSYAVNSRSNLYLAYTRGFRAGGINAQRYAANLGVSQTFDPEYSNNYELGYKAVLASAKLSLRASAFWIRWNALQFFNLVAPFTYARTNVGDARSIGIEVEAAAIPVNGLQVDASLGLNATEYKDFDLVRLNFLTGQQTITPIGGNQLSNAPKHTLFLGVQYSTSFFALFKITLRGEMRNIGTLYTDIQNTLEQPPYTLLNANLGLEYRNYGLSIWAQNITDQTYLAFGNPDTSFGRSVRTATPRTFGATLKVRF